MKARGWSPNAALLALVLVGCGNRDTDKEDVLRGSVAYRERVALPADAIVEVRLSDVSLQDVAAPVVAETTIATAGRQVPIPFELRYDARSIRPDRTYAVRAAIRSAGRMIFTTDTAYHVITRGNPTQVDLRLVRVGEAAIFRVPASRSGRLVLAARKLRFVACGEEGDGITVEDLADGEGETLLRELGAGERGIAAMVRLDGNRLQQIRYAGAEGPDCVRLPPEGEVEARGNEPFWFVRVADAQVVARTPAEPDGVRYRDGKWSRPDAMRWRYEARAEHAEDEQLTLELKEERCVDSMSGARYPFRAVLTRGGSRMEGCALEGRRPPAATAGH